MSATEASPATSPAATKLARKVTFFRTKKDKTEASAAPAYRFMVSCQGHGYPVPVPTVAPAAEPAAEPAAPVAKSSGLMHLLKGKTHAKAGQDVPAHRFMVSCQGHGYPIPESTVTPKAASPKLQKGLSFISHAFTSKKSVAPVVEAAEAAPATVPAHRFMVSCQGHGYPIPESTVTTTPTTRRKTTGFFQMLKRDAKAAGAAVAGVAAVAHHEEAKEETPAVPAYRFISTMAGYGCPYPTTATTASPKPKHHAKTAAAGILGGLSSVFKRAATPNAAVVEEKEANLPSETTEAVEAAPAAVAEVPKPAEYRFQTSMQGHGYPIPESTPAPVLKKKAKKGLFSSFMSLFKPKHQTTVAAGSA